jgi:hypothetical protein
MPLRYLVEARRICEVAGSSVLPAGAPGDLDRTAAGTEVLFVVTRAGEQDPPAATWAARFVGTVTAVAAAYPDGLPPSWLEDHRAPRVAPDPVPRSPFGDDETDERSSDAGEQRYFEVESIAELPNAAWVFVNELVPKQERGGRTYLPRAPRLVERPS